MSRIVELRDANMFGGADWIGVKRGAAGALKDRRGDAAGDRAFGAARFAGGDFVCVDLGGAAVRVAYILVVFV